MALLFTLFCANFPAIAAALAASLGSIVGGFIMKRFRLGIVGAARLYLGIVLLVVLLCGGLILMSCEQAPMMGITEHSRFFPE